LHEPAIGGQALQADEPEAFISIFMQDSGTAFYPVKSEIIIVTHGRFIMQRGLTFWLIAAAVLMSSIMHSGCAIWRPAVADTVRSQQRPDDSKYGWWYARFQMNWPEKPKPDLYLDTMLAHKIILPVLNKNRKNIYLWRFHRRAARDNAGHQFSFIFYASRPAARKIYRAITADPFLEQLKQAGIIKQNTFDETGTVVKPGIEYTSDPNWSIPIQKSWPYFIMGTSQTWLDLIVQHAENKAGENPPSSLQEIQIFYQQIDKSITASWQEEGRHAFLHHLNAIFGYEPVIVYERRLMKF
jgi:hypothetical protein